MVQKGYLKRIVVKQPNPNQSEPKLVDNHDFLVLDKEKIYLGRSKECDLVFKEKIISRNHVCFKWFDGFWNIECLNDKNGVFLNGKLLKKNQVKRLEDNYIISLGPNFVTDYIFQFTTKEKPERLLINQTPNLSITGHSRVTNKRVSFLSQQQTPKITAAAAKINLSSNLKNSSNDTKFNEMNKSDQMRLNQKKIKELKARIKYLEDKVKDFKKQRKESKLKFRRLNKRMKSLKTIKMKLKKSFINLKLNLNKEKLKTKELTKNNANRNCNSSSPIEDSQSQSIVKKYNEMFSEDLSCGVCLELLLNPVSATCGHSFCKFCINEWLKRNGQNKHNNKTCPLCRTKISGFFKNVLIENIIEKHLVSANEEFLSTRKRLIEEREKVVEKSKAENSSNGLNFRIFDLDERLRNYSSLNVNYDDNNLISFRDFEREIDDTSSSIFDEEDMERIEDAIDYDGNLEYLESDFSEESVVEDEFEPYFYD